MSAKDKIIKNIMKDKYVVSVNGKKYVEYGDVLYWLGTAGCLADGYDFVRQYIPSNKYEDDAFYDIADEFICWMWNLVEIKMASLLSDSLVSKQERKLLNKTQRKDTGFLFKTFLRNRNFFNQLIENIKE